jgi:hypothetical protein
MPPQPIPVEIRFRRFFTEGPLNECWFWQGATTNFGYGVIQGHNPTRIIRAHRLTYELHHGVTVPSDLSVLHTCDNPSCVNPAHLFLGTRADNHADMKAKGRANGPRGAMNPNVKLTEQLVRECRQDYAAGIGTRRLARKFGVNRQTMYCVVKRRTWKHVI